MSDDRDIREPERQFETTSRPHVSKFHTCLTVLRIASEGRFFEFELILSKAILRFRFLGPLSASDSVHVTCVAIVILLAMTFLISPGHYPNRDGRNRSGVGALKECSRSPMHGSTSSHANNSPHLLPYLFIKSGNRDRPSHTLSSTSDTTPAHPLSS
jgi:hypothetical protein